METTLLPQIAFGYGRVSTAKQGLSREAQTETLQRAAAFYSGNSGTDAVSAVSEMFFDEDTSGGIPFADRPSGRLLLAAVKAAVATGGSPTIIVTNVDRLEVEKGRAILTAELLET